MAADRPGATVLSLFDAALLLVGLVLSHGILVDQWTIPSTVEESLSVGLILTLYLVAIRLGGGYVPDQQLRRGGRRIAFAVAGAGLLAIAAAVFRPSFPIGPDILAVHLSVSLMGVFGLRHWLRTPEAQQHRSRPVRKSDTNGSLTEVELEDLVARPDVEIDRSAAREVVSDRTVLVTGAGGSIGSHLSSQLRSLSPDRIVLVDINEHNLFRLEQSLSANDGSEVELHLADVGNTSDMAPIISETQPDIVFHTAAYKRVPLLERHPATAFRNNTLATVTLHELCVDSGVEMFVFVSTDKAVHPTNVLGATKRWAERYLRTSPAGVDTRTVRFGNVFGSEGSVIPRFQEKLAAGEPLPVTDPRMERYFMSADEACRLLLHTLLLDHNPTYLLRMGEPIRIEWLAEKLVERWYPGIDPSTMIEHVGRRDGEKLSEELVREDETVQPTGHPRICGLESPTPFGRETLERHFDDLRAACDSEKADPESVRGLLLRDRPATQPSVA